MIGGAIVGDVGKGAAIGAAVGVLGGAYAAARTWKHNTRLMIMPMPNKRQNCKPMTGPIPPV
jgi:hypothetical protein